VKTKSYHVSNFGSFRPAAVTDTEGYVTYHDSPRYAAATDDQLTEWAETGRTLAVRNAAATEIAERKLNEWRKGNR
jgi:hypothetical protein